MGSGSFATSTDNALTPSELANLTLYYPVPPTPPTPTPTPDDSPLSDLLNVADNTHAFSPTANNAVLQRLRYTFIRTNFTSLTLNKNDFKLISSNPTYNGSTNILLRTKARRA